MNKGGSFSLGPGTLNCTTYVHYGDVYSVGGVTSVIDLKVTYSDRIDAYAEIGLITYDENEQTATIHGDSIIENRILPGDALAALVEEIIKHEEEKS